MLLYISIRYIHDIRCLCYQHDCGGCMWSVLLMAGLQPHLAWVRLIGLWLGGAAHLWCMSNHGTQDKPAINTHTLEEEPQSWQFVPSARRIPPALISIKHLEQHLPVSCAVWWGPTLPHWRPMWGSSDQGGTRKGCTGATSRGRGQPPQHQLPPERQRRPAEERGGSAATATGSHLQLASPGSSLEQPRPAAPLPGDQEPKAPCSRRRWGGDHASSPWWRGVPTDCSRPSEKLPPRPSCRASSKPIQPAPATS